MAKVVCKTVGGMRGLSGLGYWPASLLQRKDTTADVLRQSTFNNRIRGIQTTTVTVQPTTPAATVATPADTATSTGATTTTTSTGTTTTPVGTTATAADTRQANLRTVVQAATEIMAIEMPAAKPVLASASVVAVVNAALTDLSFPSPIFTNWLIARANIYNAFAAVSPMPAKESVAKDIATFLTKVSVAKGFSAYLEAFMLDYLGRNLLLGVTADTTVTGQTIAITGSCTTATPLLVATVPQTAPIIQGTIFVAQIALTRQTPESLTNEQYSQFITAIQTLGMTTQALLTFKTKLLALLDAPLAPVTPVEAYTEPVSTTTTGANVPLTPLQLAVQNAGGAAAVESKAGQPSINTYNVYTDSGDGEAPEPTAQITEDNQGLYSTSGQYSSFVDNQYVSSNDNPIATLDDAFSSADDGSVIEIKNEATQQQVATVVKSNGGAVVVPQSAASGITALPKGEAKDALVQAGATEASSGGGIWLAGAISLGVWAVKKTGDKVIK